MIHLDYRDARPIYSQVVEGIKVQIRNGVLRTGDRLPSVRELALQLTINPNTIQRAYRELENEGMIVTVAGKGCFVCETEPSASCRSREVLLQTLTDTAEALVAMGISREALSELILQGGNRNA